MQPTLARPIRLNYPTSPCFFINVQSFYSGNYWARDEDFAALVDYNWKWTTTFRVKKIVKGVTRPFSVLRKLLLTLLVVLSNVSAFIASLSTLCEVIFIFDACAYSDLISCFDYLFSLALFFLLAHFSFSEPTLKCTCTVTYQHSYYGTAIAQVSLSEVIVIATN